MNGLVKMKSGIKCFLSASPLPRAAQRSCYGPTPGSWLAGALISLVLLWPTMSWSKDNEELAAIFAADQAIRSAENLANRIYPTIEEERERRIAVMRLLTEGEIVSADDLIRAVIVLQHTSLARDASGVDTSLSAENHILAFFLARRAHLLGHRAGAHFMAWAYNYWLRSCGADIDMYGFEARDGHILPMNPSVSIDDSVAKCGFDPSPYFDAVNAEARGQTQEQGVDGGATPSLAHNNAMEQPPAGGF